MELSWAGMEPGWAGAETGLGSAVQGVVELAWPQGMNDNRDSNGYGKDNKGKARPTP